MLALAYGKVVEQQFTDQKAAEPMLIQLLQKTTIEADAKLASTEAVVEVTTTDARCFRERSDPFGRRMIADELRSSLTAKFRRLVLQSFPDADAEHMIEVILQLDKAADLSEVIRILPAGK